MSNGADRTYIAPAKRLIHKGLIGPNGEVGALCFEPCHPIDRDSEYVVMSKRLYDEITCPACLMKMGRTPEVSRGKLLRDNLEIRLQIAFHMIDIDYWNREVRKPDEDKINPDSDGAMASEFLRLTAASDDLLKPLKTAMERHENTFGWPDLVEDPGGQEKRPK